MSNPRVYYAMAEDKALPGIFRQINQKTQVQQFGLTFFVSVMIVSLFVLKDFEQIVNYVLFIDSFSLASAAAALFILRRKSTGDYAGFKMPGYPVLPIIYILVLLYVTYSTVVKDPVAARYGFLIFVMGLPLYYIITNSVQRMSKKDN